MKKTFLIEICSDLNFDGMVVDITFSEGRISISKQSIPLS